MSDSPSIDALLKAPPSISAGDQLVAWADETRNRIARGELMIGILTIEEVDKIAEAYRTAAEFGITSAWIRLAWWHAFPDLGEPDLEAAETAMRAAVEGNVHNAKLEITKIRWFFKRETATESEKQHAYQSVSDVVASNPSNAEAIYFLALLTTHGFGVAASPEHGFELLEQSADLGNADAMFEMYVHLSKGIGVVANEDTAFNACQRAADAGHSRAMYNLGAFHATGMGTPKNTPKQSIGTNALPMLAIHQQWLALL